MSDIFISYARPDEPLAARVDQALVAAGYKVWRDVELPVHRSYSDVIEERLKAAKAVVVLWSAGAAKSQWVRAEADLARANGTLVQVTLDGTLPPLPFNQIQCATLTEWDGDVDGAGWRKLAASVATLAGPPGPAQSKRPREQISICVLPFANMSGDAEQEYFSDGISEDITTDLSKVSALAVVARNTAFTFKGRAADVTDVARKLGVSHVLEGSVRKAGNRVRITAQLIDGHSGDHIWAERFDRDLIDIFAIQDELSKAIVDALKIKLLPEEKKAIEDRGTANVEAYDLYLTARRFWITGNYGDIRRDEIVKRTARSAVQLDPEYARAWALLAIAEASLRFHHDKGGEGGLTEADRALALDPTIAEAYCVKARHLAEQDDFAGANAEIAKGLKLDPNSWEVNREAARICMQQRRIDEACDHYKRAAGAVETDFHSTMMLATCYQALGQHAEARQSAHMMVERTEPVIARDPLNASALGVNADGLAMLGELDRAKERIRRAMIIDPDNVNMPYNFACVLASWVGDKEGALDLLEQTFARVSRSLIITSLADPDLDSLRNEPRFQRIAKAAMERTSVSPDIIPTAAAAQPRS